MALMYTPEAELLSTCPQFSVEDLQGNLKTNKDFAHAKVKLFAFICNHCPYVQAIESRLIELAHELKPHGVETIAICSNDPTEYEEDSRENLLKGWKEKNYNMPYLFDETQEMAKSFGAICTPDFFAYNSEDQLIYRGRLDDSWRDASKVERQEMKNAIMEWLNDKTIAKDQLPSMGCSIKWK